jgi:hypothetical protein
VTATSFSGSGANLTGIAATDNVRTNSLVVSGVSTLGTVVVGGATTQLIVTGDARVTGILTIGTGSITLNGSTNIINVGTGLTLSSSGIVAGIITTVQISAGSSTGTSGQVLQSTGTGIGWTTASAGITELDNIIGRNSTDIRSDSANGRLNVFGQGNFQVFTSPGTYVVNPGISSIRVRVVVLVVMEVLEVVLLGLANLIQEQVLVLAAEVDIPIKSSPVLLHQDLIQLQ